MPWVDATALRIGLSFGTCRRIRDSRKVRTPLESIPPGQCHLRPCYEIAMLLADITDELDKIAWEEIVLFGRSARSKLYGSQGSSLQGSSVEWFLSAMVSAMEQLLDCSHRHKAARPRGMPTEGNHPRWWSIVDSQSWRCTEEKIRNLPSQSDTGPSPRWLWDDTLAKYTRRQPRGGRAASNFVSPGQHLPRSFARRSRPPWTLHLIVSHRSPAFRGTNHCPLLCAHRRR